MSVYFDEPSTTALLVRDIQRDFLRADGRLPVDQRRAPALIESLNAVIAAAESAGVLVVDIESAFSVFSVMNIFRRFSALCRGYHVEVLVDGVASVSDMVTKRALALMWKRGAFLAT